MKTKLLAMLSILAAIPNGFAQPPEQGRRGVFSVEVPPPGADQLMIHKMAAESRAGQTFSFISSEFSFDGTVVKNAPYSAEAVTETTQRLGDGNRISQKSTSSLYRDSVGRTRREETLGAIGPWASNADPVQTIFINDPVSKTNLVLDSRARTVRKMVAPEIRSMPLNVQLQSGAPAPMMVQGDMVQGVVANRIITRGDAAGPGPGMMGNVVFTAAVPAGSENVKNESLGTRVIEGVRADGTRTIMTIPAGAIGNDLAIEVVSERWYSPELQTVVMTKRNDPRMGETVYRLININRNEPPRSLFEAPADYTVLDSPDDMKRAMEKAMKLQQKLKE